MKKIKISGKWRLYYFEQYERNEVSPADLYGRESIPCTVPGNVELELINQGILPEDIYMGQNIRLTEAYEKYEWWYETKITMPDIMLMYGKEASNRKQEIDRQHYTIPNQRPKDKHCGKI